VGADTLFDAQSLSAQVLAWLVTYALHSTVLIGGAWLAAVSLARLAYRAPRLRDLLPSIRDRLWKVAVVGGLVTATLQSNFEVGPWQIRLGPEISPISSVAAPVTVADPGVALLHPASSRMAGLRAEDASTVSQLAVAHAPGVTPVDEAPSTSWIGVVLFLWAIGVAFGCARWVCQWNSLLRTLDDRTPLRSGLLFDRLERLRAMAGARVRVTLSTAPSIAAPMTLGLRRAEICVPPRVESELRREEIDALLAHELAHVQRRDPAWLVVCRAIEVVFFFQPLNRLCASWLADEAEYLADDWAVTHTGERVGMASCLTEIAGWLVSADEPRLVAGMAARGTRLTLRVGRLLDEEHEPATSARGTWMTSALAPIGLSAALLVPGVTTADEAAHASEFLADRTSQLERALATLDDAAPSANALLLSIEPRAGPTTDDLDSVLSALDDEIESLRDELSTRLGGEELAGALDALEERVADLRARASSVQDELLEMTALKWNASSDAAALANELTNESTHRDIP